MISFNTYLSKYDSLNEEFSEDKIYRCNVNVEMDIRTEFAYAINNIKMDDDFDENNYSYNLNDVPIEIIKRGETAIQNYLKTVKKPKQKTPVVKGKFISLPIFFENINRNTINFPQYLKKALTSFHRKKLLLLTKDFRGCFFYDEKKSIIDIALWDSRVLQKNVLSSYDLKGNESFKFPKRIHYTTYNESQFFTNNDILGNYKCIPFVLFSSGRLTFELEPETIIGYSEQTNFEDVMQLNVNQLTDMIKKHHISI